MIKKLLFLSLFFLIGVIAEESKTDRKFNIAISLGMVCQPAGNLHANGLRFQSFPLDWLITPEEALIKFIANKAHDFLKKENLLFNVTAFGVPGGVLDTKYNIYSFHDFNYRTKHQIKEQQCKFNEVIVENYKEVKEKFRRRIKRFFDILHSGKKVLFLRLGLTYQNALLLDKVLHTQYPQLDYLIVAIDNTEEIKYNWNMKRVKNFYMDRPSMFDSKLEDWKKILDQFEFNIDTKLQLE